MEEKDVQAFVFQKLNEGLSQKTIKDILIVLKMILKICTSMIIFCIRNRRVFSNEKRK